MAGLTEIAFQGVPGSDAIAAAARRRAAALLKFSTRVSRCAVVIARPNHRRRSGDLYTVRVDIDVPGSRLVVNREHSLDHTHEDVMIAMRDAFHAARRRLEDHSRRIRGGVKKHVATPTRRARGRRAPTSRRNGGPP